jgi:predicted transposase/invertase (TIGR01784 family)
MILGVTPTVDYAFKHLFGRESTRPLLINVLDSVLEPAPEHRIRDLELLNPFNPKEDLDDKLSILDIKARDQSGRQFNVEMQMLAFRHYEKRILYYATKLHQAQLHEGEDYQQLQPTVSISFLDHRLFPEVSAYHLRFRLWEDHLHFRFSDDLELHILELPKFTKSAAELRTDLEIWLYFLRHAETMDTDKLPAAVAEHPLVRRAVEELVMLTQTDVERERYEARRKAQLDFKTGLKVARLEGLEEGLQQGLQQGQVAEKIHTIHLLERKLDRPETPTDQLAQRSLEDLSQLVDQLLTQLSRPS